ncbi:symmetrical bis(5'-nucleosyl)-tetraphosphatase [Acinetobacter qingfengensis]|uniref:bis(5'-nucleosyl)-tetraphosphatase (symmetrical) n=1 Tax=Acinetobacter qingfengensis TaxID=1262585 RepID=A0A1E7RDB4_9GAMM|nr:symmetrical bis(5'-nucleosyl)-tetraphosphatase [Acinetobacter qingfengensis]KAA8734442.1 symmetrical bis(5'-nucleosyl)-tetraphosphatase [Acinetobacter qingfengensis]OEY97354.1 bis(5'-nucleosyl)-tetraphosphatase (symmetrical) [Acinetobacter qingfengensis]
MKNYRHVYAIGDLQGCFAALKALLKKIQFDPTQDFIYFAGDLVARGEDSLSTLRFVKKLCDQGAAATVLGNHDLTLIACGRGFKKVKDKDQTQPIFDALDGSDLIDWLRHQPLLIEVDSVHVLTHAGIPHIWSLEQSKQYAHEVEQVLQADLPDLDHFLAEMYGAQPDIWSDALQGNARLRVITNYFTRMRIIDQQGHLDFVFKESLDDPMPAGFSPWFRYQNRVTATHKILFGHWAALQGQEIHPQIISLDGGCVWGGELIAYELKSRQKYSVFNPLSVV